MKNYKEFISENVTTTKCTVIILQVEEFRHFMISDFYGGKIKELYDLYTKKLKEVEKKYDFVLPPDNVGFCTEFALVGNCIETAETLSKDLYDFFKSFEPSLTINIVLGYGEIHLTNRIQTSTGEVLIRVGRRLDKKRNDGIEISPSFQSQKEV